ncbi:Major Facilitator Superfamily protein [Streptococcus equinus]|uniref:Major Facilitator Superfamily protein n=1 Tax=Streptococcus equinus TaxID=1335 RepID=A0A1H0QHY5_STREI|nr:MFS transporter [Streptococcus equinus]SDP16981.1 Major Facilitator Superfamily protein [Streptococcus equinus]
MRYFFKNNKLFSRLVGINLLSKVGDRLFYTAMLTVAASLQDASLAVMVVSASETLPILISLFLGPIADKQEQKLRQLVSSSLFRVLMYLGIAFIFRYPPTVMLIFLAAFFNLLSDVSGNYSTALFSPFTKTLVKPENMQEAQGLVSLGTQLVTILSTFIGASLLLVFSESSLAATNAIVFLIVAIFYWMIHPQLKMYESNMTISKEKNAFRVVKENFKSFLTDHVFFINLVQLAMLNGFFGGLTPLFALFIKENCELATLSKPLKISILSGIITFFMIIGNGLTNKIFKKQSIFIINILADLAILLVGLGFVMNSIWIIWGGNAFLAFLLGIVSPRFSADVVNRYPVERIGGIVTSVNSLLVLTPPVTSLIFPTLSTINIHLAYIGLLAYAVLLILFSMLIYKKKS